MGKFGSAVREAGEGLNWLLLIGFLGIVWLMIYGNLQGNLGFAQISTSYFNETIALSDTAVIPAGASGKFNPSLSSVIMTNATGGETVAAANYTVEGAFFTTATVEYNGTNVNVSYRIAYDSQGKVDTDTVIFNLTSGTRTFYGFSNTLFTIIAIVLLITILLALLYVVMKVANMGKSKGGYAG